MIDNQTKEKFIELRAQGKSYNTISKEIGVSKPTLIQWSREFVDEISNLKAIEFEDLQEKYYIHKRKRIEIFGTQLEAIKQELSSRDLKTISTERLLDLLAKFTTVLKAEETTINFTTKVSPVDDYLDLSVVKNWIG
ncbi:MAG: helix-turn-helix domain-containing protein [Candidatus Magasanikiibacteriota bacterium]